VVVCNHQPDHRCGLIIGSFTDAVPGHGPNATDPESHVR
jgi:hypothetical protein